MIRIFYGEDRMRAMNEIKKIFGENYETIDCVDLMTKDLTPIFLNKTLFADKRKIVLKDFTLNTEIYSKLPDFLNTSHEVILFENKLDKRTATYKEIKDKVEIVEFKLPESTDFRMVFDIYKIAKKDGKRAVEMLEKIKINEDPIRFTGLLVSQALKDFGFRQGSYEKRILKDLAKIDMQMKSSKIEPWLLVESFLIKMSQQ